MLHFYDGQIRRYITQIIRMLSNFTYKDIDGKLVQIPVTYGDMTRQVASIIRDNSENKLPSAPRLAVYITGLELDRQRLADPSFVQKQNIVERAYDQEKQEYNNTAGKKYTVEKLMPSPYKLSISADIWSTNTEQKLQILEQILMLFNPSIEIQTNDNFIDWTSLSVVELENINYSSRSIGSSTETEIDVATLGFTTPIWISPPLKVKKLNIITSIITSIFDERRGIIDLNESDPVLQSYADNKSKANVLTNISIDNDGNLIRNIQKTENEKLSALNIVNTTYLELDIFVLDNQIKLSKNGIPTGTNWTNYFLAFADSFYEPWITEIRLQNTDFASDIIGTVKVNIEDQSILDVRWDTDSIPGDTVISGPTGNKNKIDYIIDPTKTNPENLKFIGLRMILLDQGIGAAINDDGADAWKNTDGSDFIAEANDIVEWDGSKWNVVFDASEATSIIYTTNLNTGVQYKFDAGEWLLSYEGEYPKGSWRIVF